jgi:hypothetical protein
LEISRGEWIQFLDADDILKEYKIAMQIALIKDSTNIGLVIGGYEKLKLDKSIEDYFEFDRDIYVSAFVRKAGNTCSNLWRKSDLLKIGGWNQGLSSSQETDLMLRLILNEIECRYDSNCNTLIRQRSSGQISQSNPATRWSHFISVRQTFLEELQAKYPEKYRERINDYLGYLLSSILILLNYDRLKAFEYYSIMFSGRWKPLGGYGVSRGKAYLIKVFGIRFFWFTRHVLFEALFRKSSVVANIF